MESKEIEIQRALGTLNTYEIRIDFSRREEPVGLDRLMAETVPTSTRYNDGSFSGFQVEMPSSYIKPLIKALTILIHAQNTRQSKGIAWVYVHELINGKFTHITNFRIDE